jgi:hypothetical protein
MTASYLLDTNAYYLFFQSAKSQSLSNLETKIRDAEGLSFYISEITSLEVHSVLGKYSRSVAPQKSLCERNVDEGGVVVRCTKQWVTLGRKRMKPKVFQGIRKMIADIENGRGGIKAQVLSLNSEIVQMARSFLYQYADLYSCGSHDAIIAATAIVSKNKLGKDLILVTSDKGLKAALRDGGILYFDPKE